ncbi:DUF4843 domain-containing protein [Chitinophaga nivalis]|uniref:DUF4843 domain-containing protein n=1 Tax=Chitinophaga nivalis TaxID=2991709 RepID=A0ABT3IUH3_9BACT|nr:DUF4843 domain-containing protein [Chitinophaga nivalis]MCW3462950.1 DUF4843 domain-containing protein [Chitinophaga nivalis]MCW3487360.1 DUF4843 domain-containing protein [Chitinophaga nivalis]
MKKIYGWLWLLAAVACKSTDITPYPNNNDIYFSVVNTSGVTQDTTPVTFAFTPATTDTIVPLLIRAVGPVADYDREFKLKIVDTAAAAAKQGVHFFLPAKTIMPAGKVVTTLPVLLHKTAEMASRAYSITLTLEPNENFTTNLPFAVIDNTLKTKRSILKHVVIVEDQLNMPKVWEVNYLGVFTKKKILLMCSEIPMKLSDFNPPNKNDFPLGKMYYVSSFMKRYLDDHALAKDTIREENGDLMKMGKYAQ